MLGQQRDRVPAEAEGRIDEHGGAGGQRRPEELGDAGQEDGDVPGPSWHVRTAVKRIVAT
jgi:hypothetical protein